MRRHTSTLVVLVVSAVLIYGTRGSFGLFLKPWEDLYRIERAEASLISAVGFIVYGFAQPVAGRLLENFAPRLIIGAGLGMVALGFLGAARSSELWMVIISIGLVSAFGSGLASLSALSFVAGELVESRGGLIFGLLTAGAAGGQVIILPIATAVLGSSLQAVFYTLAGLCLAGAIAAFLTIPALPSREAGSATTPVRDMARDPRFWLLLLPFMICGYTTSGMIETHLIPFALDHHIEQGTASAAMATLAAFNIMGVLLAGAFTDRVDRGKMLAGIYAMRAGTLLILPFVTNATGLFVFGVLFGVADFSTVPPTTSLTQTVFRSGGWAVAIGIISASHQVGSALGAWLPGLIFQRTGSYTIAWVSGAVSLVAASYLSYRLKDQEHESVLVS